VIRGRQEAEPGLHWRANGEADDPSAPLVLAMHGWGMNEDFFARLIGGLFRRPLRFLLPRAPLPAPAAAAEPETRSDRGGDPDGGSWYAYDGDQERFRLELERVERELLGLLRDVESAQGWTPRQRFLVGFSQGGYCGSWVALRHPELFAGMAIVGARVKTEFLAAELPVAAARGFRALLCHGEQDTSVLPEAAERSRAGLAAAGVDVELRWFAAGHSLGRAQVAAIGEWLDRMTGS